MLAPPFQSYIDRLLPSIRRGDAEPSLGNLPDHEFNALALDLYALQFEHVLPYQHWCVSRGQTPDRLKHWTEIPAVPAESFKELELTSLPPNQRSTVFHSSGTTSTLAGRHYHNPDSLTVYEQSILPWYRKHLLPDCSRMNILALVPDFASAPHSSLACMMETLLARHGTGHSIHATHPDPAGTWRLDFKRVIHSLESSVTTGEPLLLAGTAYGFVHLTEALQPTQRMFKLPPGSRIMETGGYKGQSRSLPRDQLHQLLSHSLDIPDLMIVSEYGMTELSSQAYDRRVGDVSPRVFHFPPWCACRVVSPETGDPVADGATGVLQVFDLANVASVLAIQTEDLALRRAHGFEYLGRVQGAKSRGCSLRHA